MSTHEFNPIDTDYFAQEMEYEATIMREEQQFLDAIDQQPNDAAQPQEDK